VTFWYSSSVLGGRWVFLAQSPARVDEVSFGDVDGDGRCDVFARGQVFLNPDPLPFARNPGNVSAVFGTPAALTLSATGGSRPYSWAVTGLPPGLSAHCRRPDLRNPGHRRRAQLSGDGHRHGCQPPGR
jgi:hypothetical protein